MVQKFASALVTGDSTAISDIVDEQTQISGFDPDSRGTLDRLVMAASDGTVIANHAYGQLPVNLASDLATDFARADYVPEDIRKDMVPSSSAVVKANVTATQWLILTLGPGKRELIGVIVLWPRETQPSANVRPEHARPIFVVMRGDAVGDKPHIKQMVFGDPLDAK